MPNAHVAGAAEGLPKFNNTGALLPIDLSALTIAEAIRAYDALWLAQEAAIAACCFAQACEEPATLLEEMHERICDEAGRLADHIEAAQPSSTERTSRSFFSDPARDPRGRNRSTHRGSGRQSSRSSARSLTFTPS